MRNSQKRGFTLAETLITLGVIGVISAMTLSVLIKNYQKTVTVNRLKKVYSELYQAVNLSVNDNEAVENWDFTLSSNDFFETYIKPYLKLIKHDSSNKVFIMNNGTKVTYILRNSSGILTYFNFRVDINGDAKPNTLGKDIFSFYIFPQKNSYYNTGDGNCAQNVPRGGLYPDGYGYGRDTLKNSSWRGCNIRTTGRVGGAFCPALIMYDGWKISDDYKW